jgi:hypothetical protein
MMIPWQDRGYPEQGVPDGQRSYVRVALRGVRGASAIEGVTNS